MGGQICFNLPSDKSSVLSLLWSSWWMIYVDKGKDRVTTLVLLDVSATIYTINHCILLNKYGNFNARGTAWSWDVLRNQIGLLIPTPLLRPELGRAA